MDYNRRHQMLFNRDRFSELVPVNAYGEGLFFMDGDKDYIGAVLMGSPLIGCDDSTVEMIKSGLGGDCPDNTIIQVQYLSSSFVDSLLRLYSEPRNGLRTTPSGLNHSQKNTLYDACKRREKMFDRGRKRAMVKSTGVRTKNTAVLISIKIPVQSRPTETELENVEGTILRIEQSFKTIGISPQRLDATEYVILMRSILMMGKEPPRWYDDDKLIRSQILPNDSVIECDRDFIRIDDSYIRSMSVQSFPDTTQLSIMNQLIGDPMGSHQQIGDPYLFTLTIHFPNRNKKTADIRKKQASLNYQANGPWYKMVTRLRSKKEGMDALDASLEDGNRPIEVWFNVSIFSQSKEESARAAAAVRTFFTIYGFELYEDRYTHAPMFLYQMPLFPEVSALAKTLRFQTMTLNEAAHMMPLIGEWRGSGNGGALMLQGRRGQLMLFDLFDSETNYNGVVAAESGAGKSFLANEIIVSYLAQGATVRIIDQGGSYEKICEALEGEYIIFNDQRQICLNPFSVVENIDEELPLLKVIVSVMAAPTDGFDDWQMAQVETVLQEVWDDLGNKMTITEVAAALHEKSVNDSDRRLNDMADQLQPFCRHGSFGKYFEGVNSLDYENNMVVLELDELRGKKHLQKVVMLQLIAQLQTECYLGDRNKKKIILIDEAWELFEDPMVATFLEGAYRRFRKYGSSCVVITQSLDDLYNSPSGEAVAKNSANTIVLKQNAEAIRSLAESGRFSIGDYGFQMLHSLHTRKGEYSDLMLRQNQSWGVARFVADRYAQLLYTTAPQEVAQLQALRAEGRSVSEAIQHYIAIEQGEAPERTPTKGPAKSEKASAAEGDFAKRRTA